MRKKLYLFIFLFSLACPGGAFAREETFSSRLSKDNRIVLKSGGAVFTVCPSSKAVIKVQDSAEISLYYRLMNAEKTKFVFSGKHLESCKLLASDKNTKKSRAVLSSELGIQLELILTVREGLPCLFVKYSLQNDGDQPFSMAFEWFSKEWFDEYLSADNYIYKMPKEITTGIDFTQNLIGKDNWANIGTSPHDKWVYFLPAKEMKRGLGIIMLFTEPGYFGIRGDKLPYWGEVHTLLEEGEKTSYDFILVAARSSSEFTRILKKVYP